MIFTRRWFGLFILGVLPLAGAALIPGAGWLTIVWDGILLTATIVDFLLLPPTDAIIAERILEPHFSLGAPNLVGLAIRNSTGWTWATTVHDEPPQGMSGESPDANFILESGRRMTMEYHLRPTARGDSSFGDIWIRVIGRLGLVMRQWRQPAAETVKVYPNLIETAKVNLIARRVRL